ncbi:hypothetical protein E8A73_022025 [Polyangium aurulentum]|nr:hypothetical protein E8A73_022025 [Polyangium aurulentum]
MAPSAPTSGAQASWTRALLGDNDAPALVADLRRMGTGLSLSALYGIAVGTRAGGLALLEHAAAVPLAPLAIAALGVPALFIVLTLFDAPIDPHATLAAAARGTATTGLVLGGLAPAMALFVTTSSTTFGAALCTGLGLVAAGILGLRAFLRALGARFQDAPDGVRAFSGFALAGFAVFATALAARVWWSVMPIFGGGL